MIKCIRLNLYKATTDMDLVSFSMKFYGMDASQLFSEDYNLLFGFCEFLIPYTNVSHACNHFLRAKPLALVTLFILISDFTTYIY